VCLPPSESVIATRASSARTIESRFSSCWSFVFDKRFQIGGNRRLSLRRRPVDYSPRCGNTLEWKDASDGRLRLATRASKPHGRILVSVSISSVAESDHSAGCACAVGLTFDFLSRRV
jgi:hypothetical protein